MRAAILAGLAMIVAAPAAADEKVRGLIVDDGAVRYNGMRIEQNDRTQPVQHGGIPLDLRSANAQVFVPAAKRKVIVEMTIRYDLPDIKVHVPMPQLPGTGQGLSR